MDINCLISMTLYYLNPNPGEADQGRRENSLLSRFYAPTLPNNSINDITKKVHDMPISSTEHRPSPIVGKSPHGVTQYNRSVRSGGGSSTLFRKG
jgi:hypothetical protein